MAYTYVILMYWIDLYMHYDILKCKEIVLHVGQVPIYAQWLFDSHLPARREGINASTQCSARKYL